MGEVYRARDTRLGREVAIKVLPHHMAANADLRARLDREAKAISALQHPHICTLYDVGHQDGVDYLVMEFLEGETLAKRLERGALKPDELFTVAIEVAQALDVAHRRGIVHRDLKPGNVMLTKSGAKLMDFGLAKPTAFASAASGSTPLFSAAATMTSPASPITQHGMMVGTVQYMSPEQVQGREADARSDIFAFGAMLYEMATGKRAFDGKSQLSVASAILEREPEPISAVQPITPAGLDAVVAACLHKDPEERLQSAHDLKLQLAVVQRSGAALPRGRARDRRLPWVAVAAIGFALLAAALAVRLLMRAPAPEPAVRASIPPPEDKVVDFLALSPDGRWLAMIAGRPASNDWSLWLRRLDSEVVRILPGTERVRNFFWSPDSSSLGFFDGRTVRRVDISGGPPSLICEAEVFGPASWNPKGEILFTDRAGRIQRAPAQGGKPEPVFAEQPWHAQGATWMPDGEHFLYYRRGEGASDANRGLYMASVSGSSPVRLSVDSAFPQYHSGHLMFARDGALIAQPFDASKGQTTGAPVTVVDNLGQNRFTLLPFSASDNGVLVYLGRSLLSGGSLLWFDPRGNKIATTGDVRNYYSPMLSPDGRRLAVDADDPADIWVYELERAVRTRITFDPGFDSTPVWSPDGTRIAYVNEASSRNSYRIMVTNASGIGEAEVLLEDPRDLTTSSWSRDGKFLLYHVTDPNTEDVWVLPMEGERKPFAFLTGPYFEREAVFSPDGKWVAYMSTESGLEEVYVTNFPERNRKWQVSIGEGDRPRWSADGKRIYYLSNSDMIMAVDLEVRGNELHIAPPKQVFQARPRRPGNVFQVSGDGKRFLVVDRGEITNSPVSLVLNWPASVTK